MIKSVQAKSAFLFTIFFVFMLRVVTLHAAEANNNPNSVSTPDSAACKPTVVAHVVWAKGDFKAICSGKPPRVLQRMSVIYLHETLVTGDGSQAQVVFTDNSLMAFQPKTTFHIDTYQFDAKNPTASTGRYIVNLVKGGFRTVTGWIGKSQPDNYEVHTPVATIGVRGTDYSLFYSEQTKLQVKLQLGKIDVANGGGKIELNAATKQIYANVAAIKSSPQFLNKMPVAFSHEPALMSATSPGTPPIPAASAGKTSSGSTSGVSGGGEKSSSGGNKGGVADSFCL